MEEEWEGTGDLGILADLARADSGWPGDGPRSQALACRLGGRLPSSARSLPWCNDRLRPPRAEVGRAPHPGSTAGEWARQHRCLPRGASPACPRTVPAGAPSPPRDPSHAPSGLRVHGAIAGGRAAGNGWSTAGPTGRPQQGRARMTLAQSPRLPTWPTLFHYLQDGEDLRSEQARQPRSVGGPGRSDRSVLPTGR